MKPFLSFTPARGVLAIAALAALWFVPSLPHWRLDDPSYWGIAGFVFTAAYLLCVRGSIAGRAGGAVLLRLFLAGLPAIYIANWARWDGSPQAMWVEFAGAVLWLGLAVLSRRSRAVIGVGIAAHALWDAMHLGRTHYVPDWYVLACIAADLGLAGTLLAAAFVRPRSHALAR